MSKVLVTGAVGFIGMHLVKRLAADGYKVFGVDNLNDYYSVDLKKARLENIKSDLTFHKIDLVDREKLEKLFFNEKFDYVINLAAQAGVRYSLNHPYSYVDSNLVGFVNLLELVRKYPVKHFVYASSSSVYGGNSKVPYHEQDPVNHPVSLYAATKRANELMAFTYSHLFRIPSTGLRFFTVYGPWGRPDMAYYSFSEAILKGAPIKLFNFGKNKRDFTYIDDIIESIVRLLPKAPLENEAMIESLAQGVPYRLMNIGGGQPVVVTKFLDILETHLGKKATVELIEPQAGDVYQTYSDASKLEKLTNFSPKIGLEEGLGKFVTWYKEYYGHNG